MTKESHRFKAPLVVLDLEMSGMDPSAHQILQIGALRLDPTTLGVVDKFSCYVGPLPGYNLEATADKAALNKNRIDLKAVQFCQPPPQALCKFHQWLPSNYILIGYDLFLDRLFIEKTLEYSETAGLRFDFINSIDIKALVSLYFNMKGSINPPSMSLESVAEWFGIGTRGIHNAEMDVLVCREVFIEVLRRLV